MQGVLSVLGLDLDRLGVTLFHCLPTSVWDEGNLVEAIRQVGEMMEQPNHNQSNPTALTDGAHCILLK